MGRRNLRMPEDLLGIPWVSLTYLFTFPMGNKPGKVELEDHVG